MMTDDQREALARTQRKVDELNAKHPVAVGLPPEIAGNAPKTYPPSRRCGKCGGTVGPAKPGERECTCEQVRCTMADGTVVYLTRAELKVDHLRKTGGRPARGIVELGRRKRGEGLLNLRKRKGRRVKISKNGSQHELREKLPTGSTILPSDGRNTLLITEKDISTLGPGRPAIRRQVALERLAVLGTTTLDLSTMTTEQLDRMLYELESGEPS